MGADNETSDPCIFFRDGTGRQQMTLLASAASPLTIGRDLGSDLCLSWDTEVSRLHAQLQHVGSDWGCLATARTSTVNACTPGIGYATAT